MGYRYLFKHGKLRLKTYGDYETEDFWFSDLVKAKDYGFKWVDLGIIWKFEIFDDKVLLFSYQIEGKHRCMDWDDVNEYYEKLTERSKKRKR